MTACLDNGEMKRIEKDGPPPACAHVLVDCGDHRCLGLLDANGKWMGVFSGKELKCVTGYYFV